MREDQAVRASEARAGDFYGLDMRERLESVTIDKHGVRIITDAYRSITCSHDTLLPIVTPSKRA